MQAYSLGMKTKPQTGWRKWLHNGAMAIFCVVHALMVPITIAAVFFPNVVNVYHMNYRLDQFRNSSDPAEMQHHVEKAVSAHPRISAAILKESYDELSISQKAAAFTALASDDIDLVYWESLALAYMKEVDETERLIALKKIPPAEWPLLLLYMGESRKPIFEEYKSVIKDTQECILANVDQAK